MADEMKDTLVFNGISAETGEYLLPPLKPQDLSKIIKKEQVDPEVIGELKAWTEQVIRAGKHFGLAEGLDAKDLAQTGWGVILPSKTDPAILEAIKPLLDWRQEQAAKENERFFRVYRDGEGYSAGQSKNEWLKKHKVGPGPANPKKMPYYLLIVGSPEEIPFSVQSQLDVQYAVGRIHFDTVEEYAQYANSVVQAEKGQIKLPRRMGLFGVANPDDVATNMSADQLIEPLMKELKAEKKLKNWSYDAVLREEALRSRLANMLGGKDTPAVLVSATHGMGFSNGSARQIPHNGALLCQDWPGPRQWRKPIPEDFYFAADHLLDDANVFGLIAFFFACYGAGTPMMDEFYKQANLDREPIAPRPFLSKLPTRMLSHPKGGALAVLGHVERAWSFSFNWGNAGPQLEVFKSSIQRLMDGYPVGSAFEYFNERYAEVSSDLSVLLEEIEGGKKVSDLEVNGMWTANNDARNYVVLGDPAVRLMVAEKDGDAAAERPSIKVSTGKTNGSGGQAAPVEEKAQAAEAAVKIGSSSKAVPMAEGAVVNQDAQAAQEFGVWDDITGGAGKVGSALEQIAKKLGDVLGQAITDAALLEVRTFTSDKIDMVGIENGKLVNASLRALTIIKMDGDVEQVVPVVDGEVDIDLWTLHLETVKQAQAARSDLIKSAISALTSLVSPAGK